MRTAGVSAGLLLLPTLTLNMSSACRVRAKRSLAAVFAASVISLPVVEADVCWVELFADPVVAVRPFAGDGPWLRAAAVRSRAAISRAAALISTLALAGCWPAAAGLDGADGDFWTVVVA